VFTGGSKRPGRDGDPSPLSIAEVWKQSSAIPLLSLRTFVACKKSETHSSYCLTSHNSQQTFRMPSTSINTHMARLIVRGLSRAFKSTWVIANGLTHKNAFVKHPFILFVSSG
jgi:hypothetical protein